MACGHSGSRFIRAEELRAVAPDFREQVTGEEADELAYAVDVNVEGQYTSYEARAVMRIMASSLFGRDSFRYADAAELLRVRPHLGALFAIEAVGAPDAELSVRVAGLSFECAFTKDDV